MDKLKTSKTGSQRCPRDGSAGHYGKKWRDLGLFSLKKTRLQWDLFKVSHCLLEQDKRHRHFPEVHEEMVRDHRHGLQQGKFWLDIRTKFLPISGADKGQIRGGGTSVLGNIPDLTGQGPKEPGLALVSPASSQGLDQGPPCVPFLIYVFPLFLSHLGVDFAMV